MAFKSVKNLAENEVQALNFGLTSFEQPSLMTTRSIPNNIRFKKFTYLFLQMGRLKNQITKRPEI